MRIFVLILLFISFLDVKATPQKEQSIRRVKIYLVRFTDEFRSRINAEAIKNISSLKIKIKDYESLNQIQDGIENFKEVLKVAGDFRMMIIVHHKHMKKEIIYVSTNEKFQIRNKTYSNEKLFSALMKMLPKDYQPY